MAQSTSLQGAAHQPILRMSTIIKGENERILRSKNINPGSTIMAQKRPAGLAGEPTGDIRTNVHEIKIDIGKKIPIYRYDVDIIGLSRFSYIELSLAKGCNTDLELAMRRFYSFAVFQAFVTADPQVLEDNALYFDCAKTLYSLHPLPIEAGKFYDVTVSQAKPFLALNDTSTPYSAFKIKFLIADSAGSRITLGDISHIAKSEDASKLESLTYQLIDIVTAQNIFTEIQQFVHYSASNYYLLNPSDFGFTKDDCPIFESNQTFLGIGARKAIRAIEPELDDPSKPYGMIFELKKSAFHLNLGVTIATKYAKLMESQQQEKIEDQLRGVYVETTYEPKRIFAIDRINFEGNAEMTSFVKDETTITVREYYYQKYKITLQYPNYPLVVRKRAMKYTKEFYPMEVLTVLDNQRVKSQHQTSQQSKEMIKKTAIPPAVLVDESERVMRGSLALQDNPFLQKLSIGIEENPIHVQARVIPTPDLVFANNLTEKPKLPQCTWSGRRYFFAAHLKKWAAIAFSGTGKDAFHPNDWARFVNQFWNAMIQRGIQCPEPTEIRVASVAHDSINAILHNHLSLGTEYILIAHPDSSDITHAAMKFYEQCTEVVTQGVKFSTVRSMLSSRNMNDPTPQKPLTLANLLHKFNMKMGGLNYFITGDPDVRNFLNVNTLVIGFSMNHPSGGFRFDNTAENKGAANGKNGAGNGGNGNGNGANGGASGSNQKQTPMNGRPWINVPPPSVIGFAANTSAYPNAFIGDFIYQEPRRDEKIELVAQAIIRCAKQKFNEDPTKMRRLIIFRNACGEGSFESILKYEVPLVRYELAQVGFNEVKVTLIVVNKHQGIRLVPRHIDPRARSSDQNVKPGTVVDTKIVHPKWTEFFLNSHRAIQGTAKTPRYTVLLDDNNFSIDSLQKMAHHLCFCHQIVYSPTSLPTPVYIAEEYAKRGRNIYNYWYVHVTNNGQQKDMLSDYPDITQLLSYQNTQYLRTLRLNA